MRIYYIYIYFHSNYILIKFVIDINSNIILAIKIIENIIYIYY